MHQSLHWAQHEDIFDQYITEDFLETNNEEIGLKARRQVLWLSRHLVENMAKKGSQSPLQKHRVQMVSQILLRFTQRGTARALSSSAADIKCMSEAQRWGLGSAQHWIAPGRKRRQDQNTDTEQRHESQRTRLAETCRGDNKDSWLLGGSGLHKHYHLTWYHLNVPLVTAATTTFIFPRHSHRELDALYAGCYPTLTSLLP